MHMVGKFGSLKLSYITALMSSCCENKKLHFSIFHGVIPLIWWYQGSLLNQIAIANESLGGGTIVVMAERDKEEMEADIAKMEFDLKGTAVICRSGSPLILADLKKVNNMIYIH